MTSSRKESLSAADLAAVLAAHRAWRRGEQGGKRAYLGGAYLGGAYLGGADLGGAYLGGADLVRANLRDANLVRANLRGADLGGADLRGAYLSGAYLRGADLGGADLGGADLGGADLFGADLRGADLRGADLGGAVRVSGPVASGEARGYWWLLAWCEDGLWLRYGCEWHSAAHWTEHVDHICERHAPGHGYEATIRALLALGDAIREARR